MAVFFTETALEIRNNIYHELLVDEVDALKPQGCRRGINLAEMKMRIHPAILQTCKQAHIEGSVVLFEQNHFRFDCMGHSIHSRFWRRHIGRIQHVSLRFPIH